MALDHSQEGKLVLKLGARSTHDSLRALIAIVVFFGPSVNGAGQSESGPGKDAAPGNAACRRTSRNTSIRSGKRSNSAGSPASSPTPKRPRNRSWPFANRFWARALGNRRCSPCGRGRQIDLSVVGRRRRRWRRWVPWRRNTKRSRDERVMPMPNAYPGPRWRLPVAGWVPVTR